MFLGELSYAERVDAFLLGPEQVAPVVGQEHDAFAGYRAAVKLGGDAYRPVVAVVRGLPGLGFDVRVSVVLVGEHEEALGRVLAHRAKPVVARLAPVPALLEHHGEHHDVGDGLVRQKVELVQRHVGVDDHELARPGRELPRARVGSPIFLRRQLAPDVDVVPQVVLTDHLHDPPSLGLLHERSLRAHGGRF